MTMALRGEKQKQQVEQQLAAKVRPKVHDTVSRSFETLIITSTLLNDLHRFRFTSKQNCRLLLLLRYYLEMNNSEKSLLLLLL